MSRSGRMCLVKYCTIPLQEIWHVCSSICAQRQACDEHLKLAFLLYATHAALRYTDASNQQWSDQTVVSSSCFDFTSASICFT